MDVWDGSGDCCDLNVWVFHILGWVVKIHILQWLGVLATMLRAERPSPRWTTRPARARV